MTGCDKLLIATCVVFVGAFIGAECVWAKEEARRRKERKEGMGR